MVIAIDDLDLPTVSFLGLDRAAALTMMRDVQEHSWIARHEFGYVVTSYTEAVAILRDRRFHSAISLIAQRDEAAAPRRRANGQESILTMEGEPHQRLRRLVAPAFTPNAAEKLRPFMRSVIETLVDAATNNALAARPASADDHAIARCEFVETVCEPYPIPIICELLGAPKDDWKLFSNWATDIFRIFNGNLEVDQPLIDAASMALDEYVTTMIAERRHAPKDDLLSAMIAVEEAGDRLSTSELSMMSQAVLMAGTDTTRNQLGCTMALLAQHPDQWQLLRERPELAQKAVEESMRVLGAVRGTARFASEDVVYRDVLFPKGTFVSVSLATANHDPATFNDPGTFDIAADRTTAQMTFGSGIHYCLGAALARAELQEALGVLSARWETIALDGEVEWKPDTFGIWGPAKLPLRFTKA